MATVRQQLAEQIHRDNPTYRVDDYPNTPDQVDRARPVVDVYLTDLGHDGDSNLIHTLKVDCYAAGDIGTSAAEDEAETIRDNVLLSLQRMEHVDWSTCQRSQLGTDANFVGYQITATVTTINVYARTVRQEQ